ncbi:MAG: DUF2511 domain-containing protein [Acidobacteria bacterium]|nr:DUF2511 domain-containing protein [Acidobacteriota bacterium]
MTLGAIGGRKVTEVRRPRCRTAVLDVHAVAVGLGLCLPLAGCSSPDVITPTADESPIARSSAVSTKTWADGPWPFTFERGELTCIGPADDPGVFIVTDKGDMFALNPAAILMVDQVGAKPDLDPIWREHPELPGAKVNVSPMIVYALALC